MPILTTQPSAPSDPSDLGQRGVVRLATLISRQANILDNLVWEMSRAIQANGRQAIETELGSDSAELELYYNGLKAAAELLGVTDLPDLPPAV